MQKVSLPQLLHKESKTNYYVPFQQTKKLEESPVPADKITQNNNSHAQFYISTKTVDSFFCQIIDSQVSGDKITQFNK